MRLQKEQSAASDAAVQRLNHPSVKKPKFYGKFRSMIGRVAASISTPTTIFGRNVGMSDESSAFSSCLQLAAETTAYVGGGRGTRSPAAVAEASEPAANDITAKLEEALAAFKKEAALTPAERARRDMLEDMDLTEDGLNEMSSEQRAITEKKIAAEVARRLALKAEAKR